MTKNDDAFNNHLKFILEADKLIVDTGEVCEFKCPICGGTATGIRAEINGHIHAMCESCGIKIMQ